MTDADSILASGVYTDRRGREWHLCDERPACAPRTMWYEAHPSVGISEDRMRALIERDLHRYVCPGLRTCYSHPVPFVETFRHLDPPWHVDYRVMSTSRDPYFNQGVCRTLPAAIGAAVELAKEES